jgi:hypothetical protein
VQGVIITGYFAKEMPLNPDQSLGPVVIGSKIRVEKGEPLPLQEGRVEFVPGQAWDPRHLTIEKAMTPDRKKLNIQISLANTIPLSFYTGVILKQKPITLRVTLIPGMALPGTGIPVSIPIAPIVDEVSVTIPAIPQPVIIVDGTYMGKTGEGRDRAKVTATVLLPPFILPEEKEALIRNISFDVTDVRYGELKIEGTTSNTTEKTIELIAIPGPDSPDGLVRGTIRAAVSLQGLLLSGEKQLSFECGKKFILNINPGTIDVTMEKKGTFTARVLEEREGGQYYPVEEAALWVDPGSELLKFLSLSPMGAGKELTCTVTQTELSKVKSVELEVNAKAGSEEPQSGRIRVNVAQESSGELLVIFDPESKTSVSPFIRGDFVRLKAKVVPPFGMPPVHADIEFACASPSGWLKGPAEDVSATPGLLAGSTAAISSLPADEDGEWKSAHFYGNIPIPAGKGDPPSIEVVIVTAKKDDVVIGRVVTQVGLLARPMISVDKEKINFLANSDNLREGRPPAVTTEKVTVTVLNPGIYAWEIGVEPTGDTQYLSTKKTSRTSTSVVYEFSLKDPVPLPDNSPGKPGWEQQVLVHTYAHLSTAEKLGAVEVPPDVMVQGPDILLRILHEGLFVEATYEYDEQGVRHESIGKKDLVIRVEVPSEKKYKPPEIKIVAFIWDGHDMVPNSKVYIDHVREPQESKDRDRRARAMWKTLFFDMKDSVSIEFKKKEEFRPTGADYYPPAIWEVFVSTSIPANGERLRGHILFFAKKQDDGDLHPDEAHTLKLGSPISAVPAMSFIPDTTWQLEVPVELILGVPGDIVTENNIKTLVEERTRCNEIINTSFPPEKRENLFEQLASLKGNKALDFRIFSRSLFNQAHDSWAEDHESYLWWEGAWSKSIWALDKTVVAGDIAFQVLVMYATKNLGIGSAYIASTIATTIKDEGLNFYLFYAAQQSDMPECTKLYVEKEWTSFLDSIVHGTVNVAVDAAILRDFRIEKVVTSPKKYLRTLAWLWLWKFGRNLYNDPDGGYFKAMEKATDELKDIVLLLAISSYVNENGTKDIKKLFRQAQDKGYFGGTTKEPGEPKTGKPQKMPAGSGDPKRKSAFMKGRASGREKVEALNRAAEELVKNPHDPEAQRRFGKAAEEVQIDKHAMHELNNRNKDQQDPLRQQFNEFWKGEYAKVDKATRERIAQDLNKNLKPGETPYTADDIIVAGVTNTPPKSPAEDSIKSTYDRDVTYRNNRPTSKDMPTRDIKTGISKDIYNEEFYKQRHNGELPMKEVNGKQVVDRDMVNEFAEHCDQTVTDRYHADAYGGGQQDIPPAIDPKHKGTPFKDVEATAKAMEYKVQEWYNRAQKAENAGDHAAAEAYKEEGMRQLTKQFKNQVQGRVDKINEIMGIPESPVAKVPQDLQAAIDIMNRVGTKGPDGTVFTPADAEAALSSMKTPTSPTEVISKMSGVVESLQKHTPPNVQKAVEEHVKTLSGTSQ